MVWFWLILVFTYCTANCWSVGFLVQSCKTYSCDFQCTQWKTWMTGLGSRHSGLRQEARARDCCGRIKDPWGSVCINVLLFSVLLEVRPLACRKACKLGTQYFSITAISYILCRCCATCNRYICYPLFSKENFVLLATHIDTVHVTVSWTFKKKNLEHSRFSLV